MKYKLKWLYSGDGIVDLPENSVVLSFKRNGLDSFQVAYLDPVVDTQNREEKRL